MLALLFLGTNEHGLGTRAWKSLDWDAMDRRHQNGLISNPVSKAKSVILTEAGLRQAELAFQRLFETDN